MAELTFVAEVAEMFPPLPPHVVFVYSRLWYFLEKSFRVPKVVPKIGVVWDDLSQKRKIVCYFIVFLYIF